MTKKTTVLCSVLTIVSLLLISFTADAFLDTKGLPGNLPSAPGHDEFKKMEKLFHSINASSMKLGKIIRNGQFEEISSLVKQIDGDIVSFAEMLKQHTAQPLHKNIDTAQDHSHGYLSQVAKLSKDIHQSALKVEYSKYSETWDQLKSVYEKVPKL